MATKRRVRKFSDGGELSLDNLSLSEARNVARNMAEMNGDPSLKHFTWRGQKYSISPVAKPRGPEITEEDDAQFRSAVANMSRAPKEPTPTPRQSMRPPDLIPQKNIDKATAEGLTRASMGPIAAGGTEAATGAMTGALNATRAARSAGMLEDEATDMVARSKVRRDQRSAAGKAGAAVTNAKKQAAKSEPIKTYARGGGIESKGKTRGRFV